MNQGLKAWIATALGLAAFPGAGCAEGAEPAARVGGVCIAGFKISDPTGPRMDLPGPGPDSRYSFRFDKQRDASVGLGERLRVDDLPTDRRFLVEVRLDGRRTEAFWMDFRNQAEPRACLWLYESYWHWVVSAWDDLAKGCKCWPPREED